MSRWDRRNDEGQYNQRQRNETRHQLPRLSRSKSRSDSSESRSRSRSRSRSPALQNNRHHGSSASSAAYRDERYEQRNQYRQHRQDEEEQRRRQEALDSRGRAGPNGTGTGPGGTPSKRSAGSGVVGGGASDRTGTTSGAKPKQAVAGIQMKLAAPASKEPPRLMKPVANAFRLADDSDDSEPEEMPAECRMRMRNIGRDTPTSSGPNSFGKTKHGFCDSKKMFEKKIGSSLGDR
uniref:PEST proteolytic signal-containing nuclear protein n=1 Tax=Anopheles christyi TaxID=43041 RepID=A0A182K2T1_9DIPT